MTAAFFTIGAGIAGLFYANYFYHNYIIGAFSAFPEPVAKELRKALYYTNMSLEPRNAVKHYKAALRIADEIGMDPFSDEVMGIKIQVAVMLEKAQKYQRAIDVLEIMKSDCGRWIEMFGDKEGAERKRTRVLRRMVELSVKLAELYRGEYVLEGERAEASLEWAVETILREQRRRSKEGVKSEDDGWLSDEEMGGAFEALAHLYEEDNKHDLAAPLFLQAITFSTPATCHTAVLMNNLSISLAQHPQPTSPDPSTPLPTRPQLISNAREWALKALSITASITPPSRTEECDLGCAVATHNLGEFAEMLGEKEEARKRYEEARSLARGIGFAEGVQRSEEGLRRLEKGGA
ncbi:tpr domain-containing protein [Rutstroemia sp. NJR-2017a WRK4]|nr:tpr domain-containing protein [Rutstroemia sp. NJR-2017a WRK4]